MNVLILEFLHVIQAEIEELTRGLTALKFTVIQSILPGIYLMHSHEQVSIHWNYNCKI